MRQVSSATSRLIDRYSASVEDKEIEACFFYFQEIEDPPKLMKKPLMDRRVSRQVAQLTKKRKIWHSRTHLALDLHKDSEVPLKQQ